MSRQLSADEVPSDDAHSPLEAAATVGAAATLFMGGLPLIVFAFVLGPAQGLFAAIAFIAYQFVENHVIQPSVIGAAIDIAPWGTLLAAVAGGAAAGIVGAVVLTPLVGVIGVVRRELASEDFPGVTVPAARVDGTPGTA